MCRARKYIVVIYKAAKAVKVIMAVLKNLRDLFF